MINPSEKPKYFVYDEVIENADDAETTAKKLREIWSLGYDPIPGVVEMLEGKGFKVIEFDAPDGLDGMKADVGDKKLIVLKN